MQNKKMQITNQILTYLPHQLQNGFASLVSHPLCRVWQKSRPLQFFAVFSASFWNFELKFYSFIE